MKKTLRKTLAFVLALCMVLGMLPALAAASDSQIVEGGNTLYFDRNGNAATAEDYDVSLTKTIEGTDKENYFDITLTVETAQEHASTVTVSPDSAVVLTIDASVSMVNNQVSGTTRLSVAKTAALDFLDNYAAAGADTGAKRMLAVTKFGSSADRLCNWVDVSTEEGYNAAKAAINGISVNGATNYEAATLLTNNLFEHTSNTIVKEIPAENRWAIILSDGGPTIAVSDSGSTSTSSIGGWTYPIDKSYQYADIPDIDDVSDRPGYKGYMHRLREQANVYLVGFGLWGTNAAGYIDDATFRDLYNGWYAHEFKVADYSQLTPQPKSGNYYNTGVQTTEYWLKALADSFSETGSVGKYIGADNASELKDAFAEVTGSIKTEQISLYSDAWNVVDGVGGNVTQCVDFVAFLDKAGDTVSYDGSSINWDLKSSAGAAKLSGEKTYHCYEITYRVRLANEADGFAVDAAYDTNKDAVFTWQPFNGTEYGDSVTRAFPVPAVEGYLADLTFKKVDSHTLAGLEGAKFTLTHTCCDVEIAPMAAVSDENGDVAITGIPSGHAYTLIETEAPETHEKSDEVSTVTVAYGAISVSGELLQDGVVTNRSKISVTVAKTWDDADDQDGKRPDSVTVQLLADGIASGEAVTLSEDNSWTHTWGELDSSKTYTVAETDIPADYTAAITGGKDSDISYSFTVTNTHIPEQVSLNVTKLWEDDGDILGKRPEAITIGLLADGQTTGKTLTLSEANGWAGSFTELDKYSAGQEIAYSVDELDIPAGYIKTTVSDETGYTITNTLPLAPLTITKVEAGSKLPDRQPVYQFVVETGAAGALQPLDAGVSYTVDGVAKTVAEGGIIELKAGETAELTLMAGTSYKVEEIINTDYTYRVTYENAEGTIDLEDPQAVAVTVTNEYIVPDAAVVLTVDMSGTMYRNKMGGKRYVDVAKARALDFVEQYAASYYSEDDLRMLAIAAFDTDAKVVLNWVDVNTPEGLAAAKAAINSMKVADNGDAGSNQVCTNFDGGVILTRNLLKQTDVDDIDKKFAIILSDGAPTVTVNEDTDVIGTLKSSFWGNQLNDAGVCYQTKHCGGGWTHPAEVENTLGYLSANDNSLAALTINYSTEGGSKEGIFIIGVGGDMSFKLFNDAVYGTSNGSRTADVKRKPAAFNHIDALAGCTQAEIMAMTAGDWMSTLANKVGGTYVSAQNAEALQAQFDSILTVIKDITNP